jgi:hypothetical protein
MVILKYNDSLIFIDIAEILSAQNAKDGFEKTYYLLGTQ